MTYTEPVNRATGILFLKLGRSCLAIKRFGASFELLCRGYDFFLVRQPHVGGFKRERADNAASGTRLTFAEN